MTRVLSELLEAAEPKFQLHLQQLERSSGNPNHDIRLATHVTHGMQNVLRALSLDVHDTTGPELYAALGERLKADEARFRSAIQGASTATEDPLEHLVHALETVLPDTSSFALKSTVAKKLLKAQPPKKTMKALGYRSVDSMLKHESAAALYAAASLIESAPWTKKLLTSYAKLRPIDFELRPISIEHPVSERWQGLGESVVAVNKHNVLGFKELGAVVLLPLPKMRPPLATLATAVVTLHTINEIRVSSTFLRLQQVQPHFGTIVRDAITAEPMVDTQFLDQSVPWSMVHRYYSRFRRALQADIFEPVIHAEDLAWHNIEHLLTRIEPSLAFWKQTTHLGLLHEGKPTSANLTDMILSHCNLLPHSAHSKQYFQESLWAELALLYMNHEQVEQSLSAIVRQKLAAEAVTT